MNNIYIVLNPFFIMKFIILLITFVGIHSLKTVLKFGGSSIKDIVRINNVGEIIVNELEKGNKPLLVFSAIDDTTNRLLKAGKESVKNDNFDIHDIKSKHYEIIFHCNDKKLEKKVEQYFNEIENILSGINLIDDFSSKTKDKLVSYGERLSVRIISSYLNKNFGLDCKYFDSWNIGLETIHDNKINNEVFNEDSSKVLELNQNVNYYLNKDKIPIITGYICKNAGGKITTLGRGGSDLTATFIGGVINADQIQVWKDVDGLMTSDPRKVKNVLPVPEVTYEEARELAHFGAKILHPISMQPASKYNIPVLIKNSYNRSHPGTIILKDRKNKNLVTAITSKGNIILIDIISTRMVNQFGFLSKVFKIFEEFETSIDVIASSEISISLTLDKNNLDNKLIEKLNEIACVNVNLSYSIISLISDVSKSTKVIGEIFQKLSENNINVDMISQGASKNNISIIVKSEHENDALNLIHDIFFKN